MPDQSRSAVWGRMPEKGDKVYIDLGDGVNGGEIVGVVDEATDEAVIVDGETYVFALIPHIEVMSDE